LAYLAGLLLALKALLSEITRRHSRVAVFGKNCTVADIRFRVLHHSPVLAALALLMVRVDALISPA
jgi:DNA-binding PucR family transcriptional regulator